MVAGRVTFVKTNPRYPVLLLIALLLATTAVLTAWIPDVVYTGYVKLRTDALPDKVGQFRGEDVYYCQNESCLARYPAGTLSRFDTCPKCGGGLDRASRAERSVLPPDTCILIKNYSDGQGREIPVTVVFSAENQRSIHRPQRCLPGQGFVIERTRIRSVALPGRVPLEVIALTVRQQIGQRQDRASYMTYVYWYVGGDYETSSHYDRLARTAADRVFKNRLDRWAYVSLSFRHAVSDDPMPLLESFIRDLYPLIQLPRDSLRADSRSTR